MTIASYSDFAAKQARKLDCTHPRGSLYQTGCCDAPDHEPVRTRCADCGQYTTAPESNFKQSSVRKNAHDMGDGVTISHCPMCGSGQVIAGSDGSTECQYCHTSFTVRLQPMYPAFPQTVNGVPVQIPGMAPQAPGGPMDGMPPQGDPNDPDAPQGPDDDGQDAEQDQQGPPQQFTSSLRAAILREGE